MLKDRNIAVIYKSKYGATKKYAEWIAQELKASLFDASSIKPAQLMDFDVIVYGGGLYAGTINGVKLVAANPCKHLVVFTVGLADPKDIDPSTILAKAFTPELLPKIKVFHLRGAMNFSKLGLVHKGIMAVVKKMVTKKDPSELSGEERAIAESGLENVDFTDKDSIAPIIAFVSGLTDG